MTVYPQLYTPLVRSESGTILTHTQAHKHVRYHVPHREEAEQPAPDRNREARVRLLVKLRDQRAKTRQVIKDYADMVDKTAAVVFPEMHLSRRVRRLSTDLARVQHLLHLADIEATTYLNDRNRVIGERDKARAQAAALDADLTGVQKTLDGKNVPVSLEGRTLSQTERVQWLAERYDQARAALDRTPGIA